MGMRNLTELVKIADMSRDALWEDEFLTRLTEANLTVLSPDPQTGPDQWPYLLVSTDVGEESAQKVLAWLAEKGIGMAVNPTKDYPDFVLTYGMIWNFRETGRFIDRRAGETTPQDSSVEYDPKTLKMSGPPTEQYLPNYVRRILKQFWTDQGVLSPRIQVLSVDGENFDFAFSLESLGNPPASEHAGIAEAVSWFLPPHYSVVLVSEKGLPPFTAL